MKKVYVKDKDLENYDITNLKLSILFSQDGLSYSIMSIPDNKFLALVSMNYTDLHNSVSEAKNFFESEKLKSGKFAETVIVIADSRQTLVPAVLFEKGTEKAIWELNFLPDTTCSIHYSILPKSSNVVVFPVNTMLYNMLESEFGKFTLIPSSNSFIETNFTKNKVSDNKDKTKVLVQIFEDFAELVVFDNSEIKLFNTFSYKTNNDLLYFIINVFEQLKLSQEDSELIFSGIIETDNLAVLNIRKFIGQVYFQSQNPDFKYFYKFQEIAPHYYYNFLNV